MATYSRTRQILEDVDNVPNFAHPNYIANYDDFRLIRDCMRGERQMKDQAEKYLPKFESMDGEEYISYVDRATFYNFTERTISALATTLLKIAPHIDGMRPDIGFDTAITREGASLAGLIRNAAREVIAMGRLGVLIDLPEHETVRPEPYVVTFPAEHIIDWEVGNFNGRSKLTKVVLRESYTATASSAVYPQRLYKYRVLELVRNIESGEMIYKVTVYKPTSTGSTGLQLTDIEGAPFYPMRRGVYLDTIPFVLINVVEGSVDIEKPPMLDIATLNVSHFRSYAALEQGRYYAGTPVYFVELGAGQSSGEYMLGPNMVWEVEPGTKPGLLEFNGHGLKFLADALDAKESQAASLGGRMIGIRSAATTESNNQLQMKDRNEQALLLDVANALQRGFKEVIEWYSWFKYPGPRESVSITFSKDFMFPTMGAREFRAIQGLYKDGLLPVDALYGFFVKQGLLPDWIDTEEFKKMLEDPESFPMQPDAQARSRGFPDRKTELEDKAAKAAQKSKVPVEKPVIVEE